MKYYIKFNDKGERQNTFGLDGYPYIEQLSDEQIAEMTMPELTDKQKETMSEENIKAYNDKKSDIEKLIAEQVAKYQEQYEEMTEKGFIIVEQEDFDLYVTGKYLRGEDGRAKEKPPYVPNIEQMQASKWLEIKNAREAQKDKGFLFNSNRYDGDEAAQTNIANAALAAMTAKMAGQALIVAWTTFHNTVVSLSADELLQLQATMTQAGANIQAYGTLLRDQINAATSQEQLDAIVWEYDETQNYF